ncbi:MAG: HD domain-containing phosphohydrolase [Pseudomonadota bacterium]
MFNNKLKQSLRFKFLIIVSVILLASTVVLSIIIAMNEREMLKHSLITRGNGFASFIAKLAKDPLIMKDRIGLDSIVHQAIKNEEVFYAVIQDASGNLLTSQYASIDYTWPRVKDIVSVLPKDSKLKDIIATIKTQGGVIEVFGPITYDTDTIGKVTLGMSQHKVNQQVVKTIIFVVVINLVVTFIIGAILFIASKKLILDPITELAHATTRFAKGELTTRVEIKTTGEMLALVESFNRMMEDTGKAIVSKENELAERKRVEKVLQESEEQYRSLADNIDFGINLIDKDFKIITTNVVSGKQFNKPAGELVGKNCFKEFEKRQTVCQHCPGVQAMATGQPHQVETEGVRDDGSRFVARIHAFPLFYLNGTIRGFNEVVEDITDRKQAEQKLQDTLDSLRKAFGTTVQVMVSAIETRDPYTAGHQTRSADLARAIATEMDFPQDRIDGIRMAGIIHDIGKLSVPAEILSKPTKLTDLEFSMIKEHAQKGFEMLKDVESPWPLAEIIYQHHERMDGSGYPRNLKGDDILIEARIMAVADVVEAMASHRPYRPALGLNAALAEIENNKGTLYDADAVNACLRLFREKGFQLEGHDFER